MAYDFIDLSAPALNPNIPKPRGLLPVPPDVEKWVADLEAKRPMTPEARQRELNNFTLQYYYEWSFVASRATDKGVEVLAIGEDEAIALLKNMSLEEQKGLRVGWV